MWHTTSLITPLNTHHCTLTSLSEGGSECDLFTQVMSHGSSMQRWVMRAAPAEKPWLPIHTGMLTKQAELSLLGGDFDHFDDEGGALLPDKEVSHESCVVCHLMSDDQTQKKAAELLA